MLAENHPALPEANTPDFDAKEKVAEAMKAHGEVIPESTVVEHASVETGESLPAWTAPDLTICDDGAISEQPAQTEVPASQCVPPSALKGLKQVETENGVSASAEGKYDQAVFGRDSAEIGLEVVEHNQELATKIIVSLAERQGTKENAKTEESPGKIHHESRNQAYGSGFLQRTIGKAVERAWVGSSDSEWKTTYFAADSTPLYLLLVSKYCSLYGEEILDQQVVRNDQETATIRDTVEGAAGWITSHIGSEGLVEVERRNKKGNYFGQTWKDSLTAILKPDGSLANITGRIIYPEIQSLCIDALDSTASLEADKDKAEQLRNKAQGIRINTREKMYSAKNNFFISCLEEDVNREMVPVTTLESSCGRLLDSSLFDDLTEEEKQKYITPITKQLFSKEFITDVGIRTRALKYADGFTVADYHGSLVSWPIDTYKIAKGFRRQGLPRLAEQLETRLLNGVNMAGKHYEFFFVNKEGHPILDYVSKKTGSDGEIVDQFAPEHEQGWTITAILDIKRNMAKRKDNEAPKYMWQKKLQYEILSEIDQESVLSSKSQLKSGYPGKQNVRFNPRKGWLRTGYFLASEIGKQVLAKPRKK